MNMKREIQSKATHIKRQLLNANKDKDFSYKHHYNLQLIWILAFFNKQERKMFKLAPKLV